MAGDPMPIRRLFKRRLLGAAERQLADRAARVEVTSRRRPYRIRDLAFEADAVSAHCRIRSRHRG